MKYSQSWEYSAITNMRLAKWNNMHFYSSSCEQNVGLNCGPDGTLPYWPSKHVHLFLGVNGQKLNISDISLLKRFHHPVKTVILHPSWKGYPFDSNRDLAIIKTSEKIKFTDRISPICMLHPDGN